MRIRAAIIASTLIVGGATAAMSAPASADSPNGAIVVQGACDTQDPINGPLTIVVSGRYGERIHVNYGQGIGGGSGCIKPGESLPI